MHATQAFIETTGGPEVIQWREVDLPAPAAGEVLVRHEAIGLNFIDTYFRSGLYPMPLPSGLGSEAAGVVEAVGKGVSGLSVGDRVAGFSVAQGAYASARISPARDWFRLPDDVPFDAAAASMLKGCTAEFLAERAVHLHAGDWALVHAAAGGVGQILVPWLAAMGVRVIATVGSEAKRALASAAGAEEVLLSDDPDLVAKIREATGGKGVAAAYDGVGAAPWPVSLGAIAPRGTVLSFGNASGPVTGVALASLAAAGSAYVTRPRLWDYYGSDEEREAGVARLFAQMQAGVVKAQIGQRFALREAAEAQRALEARATVGSTVLVV